MEWKNLVGREGQYEVSNTGQIRKANGTLLKQWKSDQGYMLARLSGPRVTLRVHRAVAEAFCGNPRKVPFVNHIDCNRANNSYLNLEWCSQWENLEHSNKLGRMQKDYWKGKRSPNAKINSCDVSAIREEYSQGGVSWESLGKKYGVSKRSVGRIVKGESYV